MRIYNNTDLDLEKAGLDPREVKEVPDDVGKEMIKSYQKGVVKKYPEYKDMVKKASRRSRKTK